MFSAENALPESSESASRVSTTQGEHGRQRDRHRRPLGRAGENFAVAHLLARGFTLLTRNYRTPAGEIDLIACHRSTLVFVEVKTRRWETSAAPVSNSPLIWISARQVRRSRRVARVYLNDKQHTRPSTCDIRFDAIGVLIDPQGALVNLEHIEGIA